jgi:hypothetical protein
MLEGRKLAVKILKFESNKFEALVRMHGPEQEHAVTK